MITTHDDILWYSSDDVLKPLETELLEHAEKDKRFYDFGARTIVNFPHISLLVRNMPLDNMELYGQIKDMLPVLLSAANTRTSNVQIEAALLTQSKDLLGSIGRIRTRFYHLVKSMIGNQKQGNEVMRAMSEELNMSLISMSLESDQEEFLLDRIGTAINDAMAHVDSFAEIHTTMSSVLDDIKVTANQQEVLVEAFTESQKPPAEDQTQNYESDIELF